MFLLIAGVIGATAALLLIDGLSAALARGAVRGATALRDAFRPTPAPGSGDAPSP